jgi:hypothetical protein
MEQRDIKVCRPFYRVGAAKKAFHNGWTSTGAGTGMTISENLYRRGQ